MRQLHEQLTEYMTYMGMRQVDLARVTKRKQQAVNQWFPSESPNVRLKAPYFKDLIDIADQLGMSLDFAAGRVTEMWAPQILAARNTWLPGQLDRVEGRNDPFFPTNARMRSLMKVMSEKAPLLNEAWFAAGVLGIPQEAYQLFLAGRTTVTPLMLSRLARFAGVTEKWLMGGADADRQPVTNLGEYTNGIARIADRGISGERFEQLVELIIQTHAIL